MSVAGPEPGPGIRRSTDDLYFREVLAADRTVLANERTFLAYVRTALTLIVAGVTFVHFFAQSRMLAGLGMVFVPVGVVALVVGLVRYLRFKRKIQGLARARFGPESGETYVDHSPGNGVQSSK